jgi:exosome complex exonuclease RRP6
MPHGLAFAVDHFCQVQLDKKYQTADWRIRPIPAEMVHYARQDTHYLLYCYDRLRSLLLNSDSRASIGNLLLHVLQEGRRLCLTRFEKPHFDPLRTYADAMGRSLGGLRPVQLEICRRIFNWREQAAREADESPAATMHTSAILQIASRIPTSARDLLKCISPIGHIVRKRLAELLCIVEEAVKSSGETVEFTEECSSGSSPSAWLRIFSPLSGMLPCVDQKNIVVEVDDAPVNVHVAHRAPSPWFLAISKLRASSIAKINVPIPGHEALKRLHHARQQATATQVAPLDQTASLISEANTNVELDAPVANAAAAATAATDESGSHPVWSDKDAVAIKKTFGSGRRDRKKAAKRPRD